MNQCEITGYYIMLKPDELSTVYGALISTREYHQRDQTICRICCELGDVLIKQREEAE